MPKSTASVEKPSSKRAFLVLCDSLRSDLISPDVTPTLARLKEAWCCYAAHRSVFPSTTRTASASIATGCLPRRHGLFGNVVALDEGEGMKIVSTGRADFRERLRSVTGSVLARPTLAERLAVGVGDGKGAGMDEAGKNHPFRSTVIFSNASPGAAHMQDPDGFAFLHHRTGSHGPGLTPLPPAAHLTADKGMTGDAHTTGRFVEEVVLGGWGALGVLWLSEPDHTGHSVPLGSPDHRETLAATDACVAQVVDAVARIDPRGEDVLLVLASDHGQETTDRVIDVNAELIEAGLKTASESTELVAASQGTSILFYLVPEERGRRPALMDFLETRDWAEEIFAEDRLEEVGLAEEMNLVAAVSMRKSGRRNEFGVPGYSDIMVEPSGINNIGCGQHGGTGTYEQSPFLILTGGGFPLAAQRQNPTSCVDLAPTILRHLGLPTDEMDGRPLQKD